MTVHQIGIDEMGERMQRLRQILVQQNLDLVLLSSPQTIAYLTGFGSTGYYLPHFLAISRTGTETFVLRDMEVASLELSSPGWTAIGWGRERTFEEALGMLLGAELKGLSAPRIGIEGGSNFTTYRNLRAVLTLPGADVVDIGTEVEALRRSKSLGEMSHSRQAGKIATAAVELGVGSLSIGTSEKQVSMWMLSSMIEQGGDFPTSYPYVYFGERTRLAMQQPSGKKLGRGHTIYLECGARCGFHSAALTRTGAVAPTREYREVYAHVRHTFELTLNCLHAGRVAADVDAEARAYLRSHNLEKWWFHRSGYSIGIGFAPGWGEGMVLDISQGNRTVIPESAVLHLVSLISHPEYGYIGLSETVAIREGRAVSLTPFDRECLNVTGGE